MCGDKHVGMCEITCDVERLQGAEHAAANVEYISQSIPAVPKALWDTITVDDVLLLRRQSYGSVSFSYTF